MTKQVFKILSLFIVILTFNRCAQVGELTGGKRDVTAPKLLGSNPPQQSLNFSTDQIILEFDEFVQVKDLANQLIVSPKLTTNPDVQSDGKKVRIIIKKEELQPNTTYRFYLGQAIVDMNEGNPIPNFEYIFSTGNFIDSLEIKGRASEAINNAPSGNVLIALYTIKDTSNLNDSLPYNTTPNYISRSNDDGTFAFSNLPYASFKTFAFTDKNKNYQYDGETEKIAFADSVLHLNSDTVLAFKLFQESPSKVFIKKSGIVYSGLAQIIFNQKTLSLISPLDSKNRRNLYEINQGGLKDTVSLYYKDIQDTLALQIYNTVLKTSDTIFLPLPKKTTARKKFKTATLNLSGNNLPLNTQPRITFLNWMDTLKTDVTRIKLKSKSDSLINDDAVKGRWINATAFEIQNLLKEGTDYRLKIDTNSFFDIHGLSNDSLNFDFKPQSKIDFGKLTLKLLFNKKQDYVIQLINDKEETISEKYVSLSLSGSNAVSIDMTHIAPGTYSVKIIFDNNKNKKWDTGNLLLKQHAEQVIIHSKQMKILSDWEVEEEINVKQ